MKKRTRKLKDKNLFLKIKPSLKLLVIGTITYAILFTVKYFFKDLYIIIFEKNTSLSL